jgi:ATP-dependent DNA ligase
MSIQIPKPMLAKKASGPFDSDDHLFEIKWDGIRCLALVERGIVRLQSRHFLEITSQFPELACLDRLPSGTLLDGELVVLVRGKPSLQEIQRRALLRNQVRIQCLSRVMPVTFMVFDLLYLKGKPLPACPLNERRQALQKLFEQVPIPGVLVTETIRRHGCELFVQAARLGLEGIMAKRLAGPYLPGKRSGHWLKIKVTEHRTLERSCSTFLRAWRNGQ